MTLSTDRVSKVYWPGSPHCVRAVTEVTLDLPRAKLTLLRGASGSGKTTLLSLLGTLLRPTAGRVLLDGRDLTTLSDAELTRLRRARFGFLFQSSVLIAGLRAWENVSYPLIPYVPSESERQRRAVRLLGELGLTGREQHRPEELSGGEQQRVALARALVADPEVLLADEPTAGIGDESLPMLLDIFARLCGAGRTLVVVSHDPRLLPAADHVLTLAGGRLRAP